MSIRMGVLLNLNRLICVGIEGHIEMNPSAADGDNSIAVEVFHAAKYTGNVRLCPVGGELFYLID